MPFWDRNKAARIRNHIQTLVNQREIVMIELLKAHDLPEPKINIKFCDLSSNRSHYNHGQIVMDAYGFYQHTNAGIIQTVDHEVAHYVQDKRNRHVGRFRFFLRRKDTREFAEGFATFAQQITTGNIGKTAEMALVGGFRMDIPAQRAVVKKLANYVAGYKRFKAIAQVNSVGYALKVGLEASAAEWKTEAIQSSRKLGIEY